MVTSVAAALTFRTGQTIKDALAVAEAHIFWESIQVEPGGLRRIGTGPERAPAGLTEIDHNIRRLAGVIGDPDNIKQGPHGNIEACLLGDLPTGRIPGIFIDLLIAGRERPHTPVGLKPAPNKEHP